MNAPAPENHVDNMVVVASSVLFLMDGGLLLLDHAILCDSLLFVCNHLIGFYAFTLKSITILKLST